MGQGRPPHAHQLGARRDRLAGEVAELEQTLAVREAYLAQRPEVPDRLAELDGAIAHGQESSACTTWSTSASVSRPGTWVPLTKLTTATASTFDAILCACSGLSKSAL